MAGICSIHRGFDPACKLCRSIFGVKNKKLVLHCVVDTYDETYTHNIDATFLTEHEAKAYIAEKDYKWHQLTKLEVTL